MVKAMRQATLLLLARFQYDRQFIDEDKSTYRHFLFHSFFSLLFFRDFCSYKNLGLFPAKLAAMAALMFSATCGQSNSMLNSKYSSTFTPRYSSLYKLFAITTSAPRRVRGRRKLCVKNVASDKKQELEESINEGSFLPLIILSLKYTSWLWLSLDWL